MIIINSNEIKKVGFDKTSVALGSFDALHRGHIKLIKTAADIARDRGHISLVQLFRESNINTLEKRLFVLEEMGIDAVVIEDFNEEFKKISYKEFVSEYIQKKYNAAVVCAGYNYRFGHMAKGNTDILTEECERKGIEVFIQDCVKLDKVVSSSLIREMIQKGDMESAALYMGRSFSLCGRVTQGRKLGREMEFPTANMELPKEIIVPLEGVYESRITLEGVQYKGITNVGSKPTVNINESNCETHIIGFDGDLYGKEIEIEFCRRLRDTQKFTGIDELKAQLERDLKKVMKKM